MNRTNFRSLHKYFKMACPHCGKTLTEDIKRIFSDSADHACDPNGIFERPLRKTWICKNEKCNAGGLHFYDEMGGAYLVGSWKEYIEIIGGYKNHRKFFHARYSWEWFYQIDAWIRDNIGSRNSLTKMCKRVYNKISYDVKSIFGKSRE